MGYAMSRRSFIASSGACAGAALFDCSMYALQAENTADARPTAMRAAMRSLEINGKAAALMGLEQTNGKQGLSLEANQRFNVLMGNKLPVPTAIHWHGLHPPNSQDGVPGLTQPVIAPDANCH